MKPGALLVAVLLAAAAPARAGGRVLFTDTDQVGDAVASAIRSAGSSIEAALYELSLPKLTDALIAAERGGVNVRVVLDYGHAPKNLPPDKRTNDVQRLLAAGVQVRSLRGFGKYGIMHNKFAVFDGKTLETGSFNWSIGADNQNFENALFRDEPNIVSGYESYWRWMWAKGKPLSSTQAEPESIEPAPSDPSPALAFKGEAWPSYAFSPQGGGEALLVRAIDKCASSIDIAMFSFYSQNVGDALLRAKNRGVAIRLVVDRSQAQSSPLTPFLQQNFDMRLSSGRGGVGVLHDKFGVYDGELLETGSFNYTGNAENNNYENLLFSTQDSDLSAYQAAFERLWQQAAGGASAAAAR